MAHNLSFKHFIENTTTGSKKSSRKIDITTAHTIGAPLSKDTRKLPAKQTSWHKLTLSLAFYVHGYVQMYMYTKLLPFLLFVLGRGAGWQPVFYCFRKCLAFSFLCFFSKSLGTSPLNEANNEWSYGSILIVVCQVVLVVPLRARWYPK